VGLVTVKELKPYHIEADADYVHVIFAYQYLTISIDETVYKFVPVGAKEIIIDRWTKQIQNVHDIFVFQKGKNVIRIRVNELLYNPDFLIQIHAIADPYYLAKEQTMEESGREKEALIEELEYQNMQRLIDGALDKKDVDTFYRLVHYLQTRMNGQM